MDDILEMVKYTREKGFLLEIVPANDNGRIPKDLCGNPKYVNLIDCILEMRKNGEAGHLAGSTHYYKRIRDFKPFRCFPYGVVNIMPDGRLCTPCDISKQYFVNVLDFESVDDAVVASKSSLGKYPCKQGKCFKAGIIERSRLFGLLSRSISL